MDDEKIEYQVGLFKPVKITHNWSDIKEIHVAPQGKKGTSYI